MIAPAPDCGAPPQPGVSLGGQGGSGLGHLHRYGVFIAINDK